MAKKKINCWEFRKCGRELGGEKAFKLGVCPASTYVWFDGCHGGKNGGRTCWIITGTMCGGEVLGSFAEKFKTCGKCEFYATVKAEEGDEMTPTMLLLQKMDNH
ncbi:MAG: two-CW domain-containing protein [Thermodesulfovibrionales bacterium]